MPEVISLPSPHGFAANTYLIHSAGEYAIVDPTAPFSEKYSGINLKYIFLTHCHFDHILEIDSWVRGTGAEVIVSEKDGCALSDPNVNCYRLFEGSEKGYFGSYTPVREGSEFSLGEITLRIAELPGHTRGSIAIISSDGVAFVGDTVFAGGGLGRWDLPGGDFQALRGSIIRVMELDEQTVLYCGHGEPTTVKQYKEDKIQRLF